MKRHVVDLADWVCIVEHWRPPAKLISVHGGQAPASAVLTARYRHVACRDVFCDT
jgi:hypothetical protein